METAGGTEILVSRGTAAVIDLLICYFLIETPILYVIDVTFRQRVAELGGLVVVSLALLVPLYLTYSFGFEWRYGRTPGKVNRGLLVVMEDGSECTLQASAVRNLLRYVDYLGVPPLVVGLVVALKTGGKRVGDLAGDTVVVRTRVGDVDDQAATADLETDAAARAEDGGD
jgi:uncharacterized RDD family membrane protein YckC